MTDQTTPFTVRPERLIAGGEALGHDVDGRIVFVRGGLPGDELTVTAVEEKGDWSRVVIDDVLRPSPDRVEPPCQRRREGCGGCDWQHLAVPRQLAAKVEIVPVFLSILRMTWFPMSHT